MSNAWVQYNAILEQSTAKEVWSQRKGTIFWTIKISQIDQLLVLFDLFDLCEFQKKKKKQTNKNKNKNKKNSNN